MFYLLVRRRTFACHRVRNFSFSEILRTLYDKQTDYEKLGPTADLCSMYENILTEC